VEFFVVSDISRPVDFVHPRYMRVMPLKTVLLLHLRLIFGRLSHPSVRFINSTPSLCIRIYTVNHKKGGSTFLIVTLENLDGF